MQLQMRVPNSIGVFFFFLSCSTYLIFLFSLVVVILTWAARLTIETKLYQDQLNTPVEKKWKQISDLTMDTDKESNILVPYFNCSQKTYRHCFQQRPHGIRDPKL